MSERVRLDHAVEILARFNIQINAIGPAAVETDHNWDVLAIAQERQWRLQRIPVGRLGVPEDIAGAAVFLASDASNYWEIVQRGCAWGPEPRCGSSTHRANGRAI